MTKRSSERDPGGARAQPGPPAPPASPLDRSGDLPEAIDLDARHADVRRLASGGMRVPTLAEQSWGEARDRLHLDDLAGGQRLLGLAEVTIPRSGQGVSVCFTINRMGP